MGEKERGKKLEDRGEEERKKNCKNKQRKLVIVKWIKEKRNKKGSVREEKAKEKERKIKREKWEKGEQKKEEGKGSEKERGRKRGKG